MVPPATGRRERILSTAQRLFCERGYDGTTIGDIANELDISKAATAYYFPTKEDFPRVIITPLLNELDAATRRPAVGAWPTPQRSLLGDYLDVLVAHHPIALWLDTDQYLLDHPDFGGRLRTINDRILRSISQGSRRKADRLRALAALGGIWRPLKETPPHVIHEHRNELIDAALISYQPLQ